MYALRAGLSVVSEEVQKGKALIDQKEEALDEIKAEAADKLHMANKLAEYWKNATYNDRHYKKAKAQRNLLLTIALLFLGLGVYMIFFWVIFGLNENSDFIIYRWLINYNYMFAVAISLTIASVLGMAAFLFLRWILSETLWDYKWKYSKDVKYNRGNDSFEPDKEKVSLLPQKKVTPKIVHERYDAAVAAIPALESQFQEKIAAAETEYKNAIAAAKVNHIIPAKRMYSSLIQLFSFLVDERDWANLDYLIYAIETRRADSMKEALQLLDREKQTDRIVAAIQAASREIAQLLVTGFNALSHQISASVNMLSQQIQANSYQTALLSTRMTQLSNAQTLNNALLEKANESSEQLVADAHRIVELENMRYNRGY